MERIKSYIKEIQQILGQLPLDKIDQVITILHEARLRGRQVFVIGSEGGAVVADQFIVDLGRITRKDGWPGFKVIGLANERAYSSDFTITDHGDGVAFNQLENLLNRSDVILVISVAGDQPLLNRTIELANKRGVTTIGFTGADSGRIASLVDVHVQVNTRIKEYIEDVHHILENLITRILREEAQEMPAVRRHISGILKQQPFGNTSKAKNVEEDGLVVQKISERPHSSTEVFSDISRELASEMELRDVLKRILQLTIHRLDASSGSIFVINAVGEAFEGAVAYNGEISLCSPKQYIEIIQRGLAGWVLRNRQAALISNTRDDPRWLHRPWDDGIDKARSAISVPLIESERVVGVITLVTGQIGGFTDEDLSLLTAVAMFITLIKYVL